MPAYEITLTRSNTVVIEADSPKAAREAFASLDSIDLGAWIGTETEIDVEHTPTKAQAEAVIVDGAPRLLPDVPAPVIDHGIEWLKGIVSQRADMVAPFPVPHGRVAWTNGHWLISGPGRVPEVDLPWREGATAMLREAEHAPTVAFVSPATLAGLPLGGFSSFCGETFDNKYLREIGDRLDGDELEIARLSAHPSNAPHCAFAIRGETRIAILVGVRSGIGAPLPVRAT